MTGLIQYFKNRRGKKSIANCFLALADMQEAIFNYYLKTDFLDRQYYYSKTLYQRRTKFFQALQKARRIVFHETIFLELEQLMEIVFSLHLLRFRINDYAVFEISEREFRELSSQLTLLFNTMGKKMPQKTMVLNTQPLQKAIHQLESLYENTLQIVVKDPVVLVFFIQDLYALKEKLLQIAALSNENI